MNYGDQDRARFDPSYSGILVPTWGKLGYWTQQLMHAEDDVSRRKVLDEWTEEIHEEHAERWPRTRQAVEQAVTPDAIDRFVKTVLDLLERKFTGKPIAARVNELIAPLKLTASDDDGYLSMPYSPRSLWAEEYLLIFTDLARPRDGKGWHDAVHYCNKCKRFFIRARRDQKFCSDKCRTDVGNARTYQQRKQKKRTKR